MKIVHLEQEKTEIAKKYETLCTVDDLVFQRTELECTMNPTLTPDRMHRRDFNASQMPGDTSILQNRTIQNILSRWNRPLDQTAMFGPTPFELHKVDASVQTEVVAEDEDAMRRELLIKEQEIERLKKTNERLNKVLRDQYAAIDHYRQSFIDLGREDEEEIEQLNEQIGQLESQLRELQQKSNAEHSQQHADEWATLKRKLVKDDDGVSECSEAKKENVLQGVQP